ncbi:MAG TPA: hypothetical protein VMA86_01650 [Acetobacteraceae bacterium]|nr:hypothetical protein [Acetobacteraceae bacterium]
MLDLHGVSAGSAAGEPLLLHAAAQEFGRSRHPLLVTFGGRSRALPFLRFRGLAHRISMPQLYPSLDQDAYFEPSGRDWHLDLDEVLGAGGLDSRASLEGVAAALGYPSPPQGASCDPGALELRAVTVYALLLTLLRHTDRVSAEGFTLAAADAADVLTAQAMADERMRRLLDALEAAAAAI